MKKLLLILLSTSFMKAYPITEDLILIDEFNRVAYIAYFTNKFSIQEMPQKEIFQVIENVKNLYCNTNNKYNNDYFFKKLKEDDITIYIVTFNGKPLFKFTLSKATCK